MPSNSDRTSRYVEAMREAYQHDYEDNMEAVLAVVRKLDREAAPDSSERMERAEAKAQEADERWTALCQQTRDVHRRLDEAGVPRLDDAGRVIDLPLRVAVALDGTERVQAALRAWSADGC